MEQLSVTYLGSWPRDTIPSNKPAHNSTACYVIDFKGLGPSSPNTKDLRNLQKTSSLRKLLKSLLETRANIPKKIPLFLKVAPDLTKSDIKMITDLVLQFDIDGIITTNTTLERENLRSKYKDELGGLSGRPLFIKSTKINFKKMKYFLGCMVKHINYVNNCQSIQTTTCDMLGYKYFF